MSKIKIAIGADHRGFALKEFFKKNERADTSLVQWVDCGAFTDERSDYPLFAHEVCLKILRGDVELGILLCGTGAGMAMAANRYKKIYAAVAWNRSIAKRVREEDFCNVLVLPADCLKEEEAVSIVDAWLGATPRCEERYVLRREMLNREIG